MNNKIELEKIPQKQPEEGEVDEVAKKMLQKIQEGIKIHNGDETLVDRKKRLRNEKLTKKWKDMDGAERPDKEEE
jgi:hypothetical protein